MFTEGEQICTEGEQTFTEREQIFTKEEQSFTNVKQILTGGEQKSIEKDKYSVIHRGGTNIHWEAKKVTENKHSTRANKYLHRTSIYV